MVIETDLGTMHTLGLDDGDIPSGFRDVTVFWKDLKTSQGYKKRAERNGLRGKLEVKYRRICAVHGLNPSTGHATT